jgi:STE24 endopeptidase
MMDELNTFSFIFLSALTLSVTVQWWLAQRQINAVKHHTGAVPHAFQAKISLADHQKAAQYTTAKVSLNQKLLLAEAFLLLVWTFGGLLNVIDGFWLQTHGPVLWMGVAVMLSVSLLNSVLELPLNYYRTFNLEARFGFNRMDLKTFVLDIIKSLGLSLALGVPFLALVLWLMQNAGVFWWLWVWLVWMGFSLLMMWAYPVFIAPLFNQFTPLAEGSLKTRIEALLQHNGFSSQGIFVMDGSKRSGHGNAYFTGFGHNKRIVFYDTLLAGLAEAEIEAVLAHEVGHFKRKHNHKMLVFMAVFSLAGLALLAWLMRQPWFYQGLNINTQATYTALLLFMFVLPVFSVFLSPLMALLSRKHEFEADAFAAQQTDAQFLIQALVKMYQENASTLTPDPLYSAFYDSHPSAPVRIEHLTQLNYHTSGK